MDRDRILAWVRAERLSLADLARERAARFGRATDCAWSAGDGPHEVRGPVADLLLTATGRPTGKPAPPARPATSTPAGAVGAGSERVEVL